mmetsp:Transcript_29025/g.67289  ORF Transcript_29025/g.67289 Transcript_29025/m.67289 type:complete len:780 (-) Transcript_29025:1289-3628(-)
MREGILTAKTEHAQCHMLDHTRRRLSMDEVAVHQGVLQQRGDSVNVVLAHLTNILEQKRQRLEHTVLHVELWDSVLVEQGRQDSERATGLSDNSNSDSGAHAILSLLHLEIVEEHRKHILGTNGLGNVTKSVHCRAADCFLVRLEHVQQLKTNSHPLLGGHKLCAAVRNATDEVNAVLLHLLVSILQNGGEAWQQLLDGRGHLGHTNDVDDALEATQDGAQHLGILFTEVLVQDDTQMAQQHFFPTSFHHDGDTSNQICRLLPNLGSLVVQAPLDGPANLRQVGLDALAQRVDHCAEPCEHDRRVLARLLLERIQDTVNQLLLQPRVDLGGAEVGHDLLQRLHHHLAVRLALVLEVLDKARHDLPRTHLVGKLLSGLDELLVVAAVQGHAAHPEVLEVLGQNVFSNVAGLDTVGAHALLHHLEDDLLHLLVRGLELSDQDDHDLLSVVLSVLSLHQRDNVSDGLEEGGKHLAALLARALPQGLEHRVEGLDTVGRGGLRERSQRQSADGLHLLLLVLQPALDDLDHLAQVRQDGAAHQDGNLLHNLDAGVPRLPRLLRLAHGLEEGQQRGDAERRRDHGKRTRGRVSHVLVEVVDIGTHGRDHGRQTGGLGQVGNDLATLDTSVVVLVNQQGLNHDENLVHEGADEVVQLVQHAVNDLDKQVTLLIFQSRRHEQRQDLVEERAGAELARLVGDLAERLLAHRRGAVLNLEQELHDLSLLLLFGRERVLVLLLQQRSEVLVVLGLSEWQATAWGSGNIISVTGLRGRNLIGGRASRGRCG